MLDSKLCFFQSRQAEANGHKAKRYSALRSNSKMHGKAREARHGTAGSSNIGHLCGGDGEWRSGHAMARHGRGGQDNAKQCTAKHTITRRSKAGRACGADVNKNYRHPEVVPCNRIKSSSRASIVFGDEYKQLSILEQA